MEETKVQSDTRDEPDDTLIVESVGDDGSVRLRFFGGGSLEMSIPQEMVVYYRRLTA